MVIELSGVSVNAFNADSARTYIQFQDGTIQEYAFEDYSLLGQLLSVGIAIAAGLAVYARVVLVMRIPGT